MYLRIALIGQLRIGVQCVTRWVVLRKGSPPRPVRAVGLATSAEDEEERILRAGARRTSWAATLLLAFDAAPCRPVCPRDRPGKRRSKVALMHEG